MNELSGMEGHFAKVANVYRDMRTTDEAPILHIRDRLAGLSAVAAADVGCGAGRYDSLLFRHLNSLSLACVDISSEMLAQLTRHLEKNGIRDFETVNAGVEEIALADQSLDCVFTFNAIHHFDFQLFLSKAKRAIRKDGQVFIYTRTPEQNAGSIWGRFFPGFSQKESRLYRLEEMEKWVGSADGLEMIEAKTFRFPRTSSLERLIEQARNRHYSTFSLFGAAEFDRACQTFEEAVRAAFDNPAKVTWDDQNILLRIGRTDG